MTDHVPWFSETPYDVAKLDACIYAGKRISPEERAYLVAELRRWIRDAVTSWEGWEMPPESAGKRMGVILDLLEETR